MKKLAILLALAASVQGQTAEDRGKKIVTDAIQALGGDAFLRMNDRVESGRAYSFYRERLTGLSIAKIYTRYLDPEPPATVQPGLRQRERQVFGKDEDVTVLFQEEAAYTLSYRGARPMASQKFDRYLRTTRQNVLYMLRERLKEPGLIIESKGSEIIDNLPVDTVHFTDSENNVVIVYFQKSTKLPVRQVFYFRDPLTKDRIEEQTLFTLYRDVGNGVQWPYHIQRQREGQKIYEIFSESVSVNSGLKDDLFTLPAGVKMLPAEKN
jgi:hypothetical protein